MLTFAQHFLNGVNVAQKCGVVFFMLGTMVMNSKMRIYKEINPFTYFL